MYFSVYKFLLRAKDYQEMAESEGIVTILLSIVSILITLLVPLPIKDEYRLFIVTIIAFIFLLIILYRFDERMKR